MEKKIESYKSKKEKANSEQFNINPRSLEDVVKSHMRKGPLEGSCTWVSPTSFFLDKTTSLPHFNEDEVNRHINASLLSRLCIANSFYGLYISAGPVSSFSSQAFPVFMSMSSPKSSIVEYQEPYKKYAPLKEADLLQSKAGIGDMVEKHLKIFESINPLAKPVLRVKDKITYKRNLEQRYIREEYNSRIDYAASYFGNDTDFFGY